MLGMFYFMRKSTIDAGHALADYLEEVLPHVPDPGMALQLVECWRNEAASVRQPATKYPEAADLAKELLDSIGRVSGRKLTSDIRSSSASIRSLLRAGITSQTIRRTIKWLETENPKREYPFTVASGRSLKEKWDRIQLAMANGTKSSQRNKSGGYV